MEKNKNLDIREQTLRYGIDYPIDEELIMMIIGSGTKKMPVNVIARRILETINGSNEDEIVTNLLKLKGVGEGKALAIASALELGKRRNKYHGMHINSPCDIVPFVKNYSMEQKEHFIIVILNGAHNIKKIHVVSIGTLNKTIIHPREVFREVIKENAASIILCHNHPSGKLAPSEDDIETTKILIDAANILGIQILDHVIISCESYFSFLEHEVLFQVIG